MPTSNLLYDITIGTIKNKNMASIKEIVSRMRNNPQNIRFNDLTKICEYYFGAARQNGTSHKIYKTPWPGDPRVNIQNDRGRAKSYQVKQVLFAIEKLTEQQNEP